jgi:hypothetical protein
LCARDSSPARFFDWVAKPLHDSAALFAQLLLNLGCGANDVACAVAANTSALVAAGAALPLRRAGSSADDGLGASHNFSLSELLWAPAIDGVTLVEHPAVTLARGGTKNVSVIVGSVREEGAGFVPADILANLTRTDFELFAAVAFGSQ